MKIGDWVFVGLLSLLMLESVCGLGLLIAIDVRLECPTAGHPVADR
jgi:hypothetical protein